MAGTQGRFDFIKFDLGNHRLPGAPDWRLSEAVKDRSVREAALYDFVTLPLFLRGVEPEGLLRLWRRYRDLGFAFYQGR